MRPVKLAATRFARSRDRPADLDAAERVVRLAAKPGASVICVQEFFATPCTCITEDPAYFVNALPFEGNPIAARSAAA